MSEEIATPEEKVPDAPRSPYAVLFELEGVAANVRRAEYDALCNLITDGTTPMNVLLYARHCLNRSPAAYLKELLAVLGSKSKDISGLAKEIQNGTSIFLTSDEATLNSQVAAVLEEALSRHMGVLVVTGLPESLAKAALQKWGAPYDRLKVISHATPERRSPDLDDWLRMAKAVALPARQCVALASSQLAVKSALSAGLRCIAVPDEFTSFQDFSGADAVLDAESDWPAAELLETVAPVRPFI